jgi:hypothetical protein
MTLSKSERRQFVEKGYVVRQVAFDRERVHQAIDLTWAQIDPRWHRDDPDTWHGEIEDSCHVMSVEERRGRLKFRECVKRTPWLIDTIYGNAHINAVIRDLLGPTGGPRRFIRGLYPNFPSPGPRIPPGGMDGHPFQVGVIVYLSDVVAGGGGFTLWAGSHRIMRYAFEGHASWTLVHEEDQRPLRKRVVKECPNVEISGPAGTTIFWHHRLLHTPSRNSTRNVRHALVADFVQREWESRVDEPHREDMWDGWAVGDADGRRPMLQRLWGWTQARAPSERRTTART